jgi:hypothetical protein
MARTPRAQVSFDSHSRLTVYERSNASSQLSLAELLFEQMPSNANPAAVRSEPIAGFTTAPSSWPLDFLMTITGERQEPSRRLPPTHPFHEHRSSNLPVYLYALHPLYL